MVHAVSMRLVCVFALLALAGCEGNDGPPGPAGPTGQPGPPGPVGPAAGVPASSAARIRVAIDAVTAPVDGGPPVVEFSLTNERGDGLTGLPAATVQFAIAELLPGADGGSSHWQSYVTRASGGVANAQGTPEPATDGTYVELGDGRYEYTFAQALTAYVGAPQFDPAKTHRVGLEIRTSTDGYTPSNIPANNAPLDFVPAGGAPTFTRLIVDTEHCNRCHDRLAMHGGARVDVEYCVICHNASSIDTASGNTIDFKRLIHIIHAARPDYHIGSGNDLVEWSDVEYPQDIRNCDTCHDESDDATPQAANYRLVVNRAACGTCHYDDGDPTNGVHDYAIENGVHPDNLVFSDDIQCLDCHGPNGTVTNAEGDLVRVPAAHALPALAASGEFQFNVVSVIDAVTGQQPKVTFSVTDPTNGDAFYDIGADPEFTACASGASRLAIDIGWSTSDYTNRDSGVTPALPVSIDALPGPGCGGSAVDNGDGTFTVVSPVALPAAAAGTLAVGIEGHPWKDLDGDGLASSEESIAVKAAVAYAGIDGATAVPRRRAVDIAKCDECHKQLSLHGGNRTDNPQLCVICHNPNMTDVNRRAGDCAAAFGTDDVPTDFKRMVHLIHASGTIGQPFNVCGFGNRPITLDFVFPGKLNNCEGCHVPDGYDPAEPGQRLGTTIDVNDPATFTDDRVISPNAAVCSACHQQDVEAEHMKQNGADFNATKAADGTLISASVETCALCHGPGRVADVKVMHHVADFDN
jgi:OmcA/MtrC family decaheme c-type cytochrome